MGPTISNGNFELNPNHLQNGSGIMEDSEVFNFPLKSGENKMNNSNNSIRSEAKINELYQSKKSLQNRRKRSNKTILNFKTVSPEKNSEVFKTKVMHRLSKITKRREYNLRLLEQRNKDDLLMKEHPELVESLKGIANPNL